MKKKSLSSIPGELAEKYDDEADELGVSRSEYVRKCIEVGRLTFRASGKVNMDRLRNLTENESISTDSNIETSEGDVAETILANLSTEENQALSPEELREVVFGTKSEQKQEIVDALKQLRKAGRIEALVGDKYIKTEDYND